MGRRRSKASAGGIVVLLALLCTCGIPASAFNAMQEGNYGPAGLLCLFVLAIIGILFAIFFLLSKTGKHSLSPFSSRLHRSRQLLSRDIEGLTGLEFEHYLKELLEKMGYAVQVTPPSGDQGVDLIAQRGTERIAIQAKKYANSVPRNAVSDAVAGMTFYNCNRAMVITNSTFSKGARELAHATNCELVDGDVLANWLARSREGASLPNPTEPPVDHPHTKTLRLTSPAKGIAMGQDRNLSEYGHRNRLLTELGFTSYDHYLQSPTWNSIREQVRQRDRNTCRACAKRGIEVHHLRYDRQTLLGRDLNWLITLCRECHEWIEHDAQGNKLSVSATNRQLEALLSRATAIDASFASAANADLSTAPLDSKGLDRFETAIADAMQEWDSAAELESEDLNPGSSPAIDPVVLALVFHRDQQRCRVCRKQASQIYGWGAEERRSREDLDWLLSLCSKCFRDAWHKPDGELRNKVEADEQLASMLKEAEERRSLGYQSQQLIQKGSRLSRGVAQLTSRLGALLTRWFDS